MATVRCPNCGTVNPNGRRLLARCRKCHVYLAACRYCSYYDPRLLDCTHPARPETLRITDPSEALNCSDFSARSIATQFNYLSLARTSVLAVALAAVIIFGVVRAFERTQREEGPVALRATVSSTAITSMVEGPFSIRVLVLNEADRPARDVQVYISGPGLRELDCEGIEPPEAFVEQTTRSVCGWIGSLQPGEIGWITFWFRAREPCQLKLTARITAANLESPEAISIEGAALP